MTYLATSISACKAARELSMRTGKDLIQSVLTLIILFGLFYFPYYAIQKMRWNHHFLNDPKFKAAYGTLYTDVEFIGNYRAMFWTGFHCIRRLVLAMSIAWLSMCTVFQILIIVQSSLVLACYTFSVNPMRSFGHNFLNNSNEAFILFAAYYILLYSNYNTDFKLRVTLANIYLFLIGSLILMNVLVTIG